MTTSKEDLPQNIATLSAPSAFYSNTKAVGYILFCFAILLYGNTLGHDFVLDDYMVIKLNSFTKQGLGGIWDLLTKDSFYGYFDAMKEDAQALLVSGGRYRPFSLICFAIIHAIFGANPFVFHMFTIVTYAVTCVLLYKTLVLLMKEKYGNEFTLLFAFIAALLFTAHPIHTEVVANVKGCDEILALMASLACLYSTLKAWDGEKKHWLWSSFALFFLACMSKENAVTFILVVPLSLWVFRSKSGTANYSKVISGLAIAFGLFFLLRGNALNWQFGNQQPMELLNNPFIKLVGNTWQPFSNGEWLGTIMVTLIKYISLLVFPHPLTHDYYPRQIATATLTNPIAIMSLVLHICLLGYGIKSLLKKEVLGFSIVFYLITLSIASNLLFSVGTLMNERFLFMPSIGFCMAVSAILLKYKIKLGPRILLWIVYATVLLYSLKTVTRNVVWKNNETLFIEDVKISSRSAKAHDDCGGVLFNKANKLTDKKEMNLLFQEAIGHFDEAIKIKPVFRHAHMHRAASYHLMGNFDKAIAEYKEGLNHWPGDLKVKAALALSLREKAFAIGKNPSEYANAQIILEEAIQYNAEDAKIHWLMAVAYAKQGKFTEAIPWFEKAVNLEPNNAGYNYDIGTAYFKIGNAIKGGDYYSKAISIDPSIEQKRKK